MKLCLIGQNLTNLILATVLAEKKLSVDLYINNKTYKVNTNRTIAISAKNFSYLKGYSKSIIPTWRSKEIKIFIENGKSREIINFQNKKNEVFNLSKYSDLSKIFINKAKRSKNINLIKLNTSNSTLINKIKNYDLVINSDSKNLVSRKYFINNLRKNYKSTAYTFTINHEKNENNIALQIFTKFGPLAFLPISKSKTSIVFSYSGKPKSDNEILKLFNNYNNFYKIKKTSKIEKFHLSFLMLRNYTNKNILAFGDLIHRIHPLAGQGFNMTIRDIKNLSSLIDKQISLGLPIDISVANEFEKLSKPKNYLYGRAIDFIHEFFQFDSKVENSISKPLFSFLNKNSIFKKYSNIFSEKGFDI